MKKMPWGAGSISGPDADGMYDVRISLGSVDGRRRRVRGRARSLSEARRKLDELQARYGKTRGRAVAPKLAEYLEAWISARERTLEAKTVRNYRQGIATISPRLGHIRIDRLDQDQIAGAIAGLRADGKGERTLSAAYDTLRGALNWAVRRDRLIAANPIVGVERPRSDREIDFLTRDEAKAFLREVADDHYRALFHLAVSRGMRLGEILGLHWREVDLDAGALTITRALKETREVGKPKSKTSRRRIDLPPSIVRELREHRKKTRMRAHKTDLVFSTRSCTALHASNLERRHFLPALERAGVRRIRFHDLRHTCATLLLTEGVNPKIVQELLGHSNVTTTLNLYGHVAPGAGRAAAEEMDRILG